MKEYKNYIFDLYGTLVDIETDEYSDNLWRVMADNLNAYGTNWEVNALKKTFFEFDNQERERIKKILIKEKMFSESKELLTEVNIERVFARVLIEAPEFHNSEMKIDGKTLKEYREDYKAGKDVISEISESEWTALMAVNFRTVSRKYIRLFEDTCSVLEELNNNGKNVYLLSNALRVFTLPEMENLGILKYFKKIRMSSDYEIMKPQKEFLEDLIKEEGLKKEETVMVGNEMESDMKIAHICGIDGIMHNTMNYTKKEINKSPYNFEVINTLGGLL